MLELSPSINAPIHHVMRLPRIKICGIMREVDALHAAAMGADMVGMVFAPSRRQVSSEVAARIVTCLSSLEQPPRTVGVFVNESEHVIYATASSVGLDIIQLSGDETPGQVGRIAQRFPVIKALRFPDDTTVNEALIVCEQHISSAPKGRIQLLIDTYQQGSYGGTGETANWSLAARLAERYSILLAGGLNPENVAKAVSSISPFGVDVSSGVERNGQKDGDLITGFIHAARHDASHRV